MIEKIVTETSLKIRIKWNFELIVFELVVSDLYFRKLHLGNIEIVHKTICEVTQFPFKEALKRESKCHSFPHKILLMHNSHKKTIDEHYVCLISV